MTLDQGMSQGVAQQIIEAIREKIPDAIVDASGGDGHYRIAVTSVQFAGRSSLERQRLVYSAIAQLMAGDRAPVHAVDQLKTMTP